MFGHLWSLGIEEQFYLLWPFAVKKWFRHKAPILFGRPVVLAYIHDDPLRDSQPGRDW